MHHKYYHFYSNYLFKLHFSMHINKHFKEMMTDRNSFVIYYKWRALNI